MNSLVFTPDGLFEFELNSRGQQVISPVLPRDLPRDSFAKIVENVCYIAIEQAEGTDQEEEMLDRCNEVAQALYTKYHGSTESTEEQPSQSQALLRSV